VALGDAIPVPFKLLSGRDETIRSSAATALGGLLIMLTQGGVCHSSTASEGELREGLLGAIPSSYQPFV